MAKIEIYRHILLHFKLHITIYFDYLVGWMLNFNLIYFS